MAERQYYAVVGGADEQPDAVRAAIDAVRSFAATFECDIPLSQRARWSPEVREAAERLTRLSVANRGQSDEYRQTGVLRADLADAWTAFATFAAHAYDASVWDADGDLILSLADEGHSCVIGEDPRVVGPLHALGIPLELCRKSSRHSTTRDADLPQMPDRRSRSMSDDRQRDTFAGILAIQPLVWIPIDLAAISLADSSNGTQLANLAFLLVQWPLLAIDSRRLRAAGIQLSAWWGVFLCPIYLYKRRRRTGGRRYASFWVAGVCLSAAIETMVELAMGIR